VAVALTDPTVALTEKACQITGSIHNQVARLTTALVGGLKLMLGEGRVREFSA